MKVSLRSRLLLLLGWLPLAASATAPFAVNGLHLDLPFNEALAWAERTGGSCSVRDSRTQVGRVRADCSYPACAAGADAGPCTQAALPDGAVVRSVTRVGFEAQAENSPLTRAVVQFGDSLDSVAQALRQAFGPPATDTAGMGGESWSHSRGRLGWTEGNYHMGLLDVGTMIILTVDRPAPAAQTEGPTE